MRLMSLGMSVLEVTVSFFLSKEANASWETARIFCSCSKAMRQALMPYVLRQLCWPADILSKFTGELVRWRENVLYMVGYLGNFPVPALLQHLSFDHAFNQVIVPGELPATLTKLTFGARFNHPIGERVLPPLLTHLSFGSDFNQPLGERVLPTGLTHLAFGSLFKHPIGKDRLPPGLTELRFGHDFNHSIGVGVLPESLTELSFGHDFNKAIDDGVLPRGLKRLTLPKWMIRCPEKSNLTLKRQDALLECGITMRYLDCSQCHIDCSAIKNCPDCKCPNCQRRDGCNCKDCQKLYAAGVRKRWTHEAFLKALMSSSDEE